jgi:hypothetical protein
LVVLLVDLLFKALEAALATLEEVVLELELLAMLFSPFS